MARPWDTPKRLETDSCQPFTAQRHPQSGGSSECQAIEPVPRPRRPFGMLAAPMPANQVPMGLNPMSRAWIDLLLPPLCALCGDLPGAGDLCENCEHLIIDCWPPSALPCRGCGMPAPPPAALPNPETSLAKSDAVLSMPESDARVCCDFCKKLDFEFDSVFALAIYQGAVREAIVANKHGGSPALAPALGRRLATRVAENRGNWMPERVTFVPSPLRRRLARGGQGGCQPIAAAVAHALDLDLIDCLRLTRSVAKQSLLPDARRRENVRGAFGLKKSYGFNKNTDLAGRNILLVDDVLTTGATASEVARILKRGGAASVHLAVVARAVRR